MACQRSLFIIIYLILSLIIQDIDAKCYARVYGEGSKGKRNTLLNAKTVASNREICKKISKPKQCAKNDKCLWIFEDEKSDDRILPFALEGPTVRSIKYIPTEMATEKQIKAQIEANMNVPKKTAEAFAKVTAKEYKENLRIRTIDPDNIMYEIQLTDFDHHVKQIEKEEAEMTKWFNKLIKHQKQLQMQASHHQTTGHKIHTPPLVPVQVRRRLLPTPVANVDNAPWSSVGIIRIVGGNPVRNGVATGTIIHVTQRLRKEIRAFGKHIGYAGYQNHKFIYVLAAAHDLVTNTGAQYAPLNSYSFWPKYQGTEAARLQAAAAGNNDQNRLTRVGRMERAWIVNTYHANNLGNQANAFDVAIMKFRVHHTFEIPAVQFDVDPNMPAAQGVNPHNLNLIVYDSTFFVGAPAGAGPYRMDEQQANIFCVNALCEYHGLKIVPGYCGGPVIYNGKITAMQTSAAPINGVSTLSPGNCLYLTNYVRNGTNLVNDYSNCKGYAAKMSVERIQTITFIKQWDRVSVPEFLDQQYHEVWREVNFQSKKAYNNMYQHYHARLPYSSNDRTASYDERDDVYYYNDDEKQEILSSNLQYTYWDQYRVEYALIFVNIFIFSLILCCIMICICGGCLIVNLFGSNGMKKINKMNSKISIKNDEESNV